MALGEAAAAPEEPCDGTKQETDSPARDGNMASAIYRRASRSEFNPATQQEGRGGEDVFQTHQPQGPNTQVHFSQQTREDQVSCGHKSGMAAHARGKVRQQDRGHSNHF